MNRLGRAGPYLAIPLIVFGLSQLHGDVLAPQQYEFVRTGRLVWAAAYTLLLMTGCYVAGLPGSARSMRSAALNAVMAVVMASLGISLVQLGLGDALLPRFVVFGSAMIVVPSVAVLSRVYRAGVERGIPRDRVFFVGGEAERMSLDEELRAEPERPATLVGWREPTESESVPGRATLTGEVLDSGATVLVLDLRSQTAPWVVAAAAEVHESGTRVRTLSLFYEEWLGKLPVSELERVSLLFDVGELHRARYARVKRIMDVLVAVFGVLVLAAVTPLVVIGDLIANRGPLLFRQPRVGKGGDVFTILKFRTMIPGSGDGEWTSEDDPRITRFGRVMRVSHLDELPQMVNILRGDLTLVGPRPEQPKYVDELSEKLPFYRVRHLVRPGLTGWAQVKYGYAGDERDALEKLQYEFFYLRRQSFALDLRILGRTSRTILRGDAR